MRFRVFSCRYIPANVHSALKNRLYPMGIIIPNRAIRNSVIVNDLHTGVEGNLTEMGIFIFFVLTLWVSIVFYLQAVLSTFVIDGYTAQKLRNSRYK